MNVWNFQYLLAEHNLHRNYLRVTLQTLLGILWSLSLVAIIFVLLLISQAWSFIPQYNLFNCPLYCDTFTSHWVLPNLQSLCKSDRLPSILSVLKEFMEGQRQCNHRPTYMNWFSFQIYLGWEESWKSPKLFLSTHQWHLNLEEGFLTVTIVYLTWGLERNQPIVNQD